VEQTPLSDLAVYRRLVATASELDELSRRCLTPVGEAALQTAGLTLRNMASAVYEHGLNDQAPD
jgi:hypothetical protein